jgi:hypothetical protein
MHVTEVVSCPQAFLTAVSKIPLFKNRHPNFDAGEAGEAEEGASVALQPDIDSPTTLLAASATAS